MCSRALIGEPLQPGALTFRGSIRSAPYGGTMADESDNAAIGDQLLIALAALRAIAQAVPAKSFGETGQRFEPGQKRSGSGSTTISPNPHSPNATQNSTRLAKATNDNVPGIATFAT